MGRGNESLFVKSGLHDQDGRHAHIWLKPLKNLLHQSRQADFHENRYVASMDPAHHNFQIPGGGPDPRSPPPLDPCMTLTHFTATSILETEAFTWEKVKTMDFFKNDCSLRPEKW